MNLPQKRFASQKAEIGTVNTYLSDIFLQIFSNGKKQNNSYSVHAFKLIDVYENKRISTF